jgi:Tat protein secretion system quality control protein TatD with DNase activity
LITSRTQTAPDLIRAISIDRLLVESDTHDVRRTAQLVWAATRWIAGCRGSQVEDGNEEWDAADVNSVREETGTKDVGEVWAVRTLERNMARFLGLVDDP